MPGDRTDPDHSSRGANWFVGLSVSCSRADPRASTLGSDFLLALVAPPAVRLFAPSDLHITLAFLGRVGEERARASFSHARGLQLAALTTELGSVVALGPRRRPSAFAALPTRHKREIEAAMTAARDVLCDAAGAERETRPALAHVTFARPARRASASEAAAARAWAAQLELGAPQVRIESVALYTRSDDPAHTRFRIVAEEKLASSVSDS